jgi:hypothetical protein
MNQNAIKHILKNLGNHFQRAALEKAPSPLPPHEKIFYYCVRVLGEGNIQLFSNVTFWK